MGAVSSAAGLLRLTGPMAAGDPAAGMVRGDGSIDEAQAFDAVRDFWQRNYRPVHDPPIDFRLDEGGCIRINLRERFKISFGMMSR